ncbi:MAG: nitronate monooxygenase [Candidatus Omnitrophica bacterium]|nr:nitronate monooxygenase [Candidatus Omnitrophota bacterium]
MGVGVSGWPLARAVSRLGQLGVVSGTALDVVLARRLQGGDPEGSLRRALAQFPSSAAASRVLAQYFLPGGKPREQPFRGVPMFTASPTTAQQELAVIAGFVEVWLAKEGHAGLVGINFLEKIQLPLLPILYGALLAGVDYVLVGAGIPREIPGVLDQLARHEPVSIRLHVEGTSTEDEYRLHFDPRLVLGAERPALQRPKFLAIIASSTLALALAKKATGRVDGFVIEGPTAGGHNAPPRGDPQLNERGEPVYGEKDVVDLEKIRMLGLPFWLAGSYGHSQRLRAARSAGAAGVQVGTAFAFCEESGLAPELKAAVLERVQRGRADVFTDPLASASGFPFKVVTLESTLSEAEVYAHRPRLCDLGYLRHVYKRPDGSLGYRCPGEPVEFYVKKGGVAEETIGCKCLCNGLMATIGLAQRQRNGYLERPLVTAGDDVCTLGRFLKPGRSSYTAREVIQDLLGEVEESVMQTAGAGR